MQDNTISKSAIISLFIVILFMAFSLVKDSLVLLEEKPVVKDRGINCELTCALCNSVLTIQSCQSCLAYIDWRGICSKCNASNEIKKEGIWLYNTVIYCESDVIAEFYLLIPTIECYKKKLFDKKWEEIK